MAMPNETRFGSIIAVAPRERAKACELFDRREATKVVLTNDVS